MPSQKISQFPAQTTVASGDILALVTVSGGTFDNKRIGIDVLDNRYHPSASGGAALEIAVEALASGNAALVILKKHSPLVMLVFLLLLLSKVLLLQVTQLFSKQLKHLHLVTQLC